MTTTAFIIVVAVAAVAFVVVRTTLRLARGILRVTIRDRRPARGRRFVAACRPRVPRGGRVVTVRYREPGPPLGLGRDRAITLSVDGVAGCAGGGGARMPARAPSR